MAGKLDSLKNGQRKGGFKPKHVDIGIASDTPMAEAEVEKKKESVKQNVEKSVSSKPKVEKEPIKKEKQQKTPVEIEKYALTEDTKKKRLNLGIQMDILNYIKFKALRTGIPQYQLVNEIVAKALVKAKKNDYKFNSPEILPYRVKQSTPAHFATDLSEDLINDVKEYSKTLLMTPTQFYGYALTEARHADKDFEF